MENSQEVAFLSKTLATIDVNVPVRLDLEAAAFAGRPFLTPEAEALFHRLGFKSLLPKRDVVLRDVTNLGADFYEISSAPEIEILLKSIKNAGGCSFATFEEKGRFAGCSVGVEGKYAVLRAKSVALAPFVRELLSADVEIRGFDLKADMKSVYRYLEDGKVSAEEMQGSLF
ncbi:MAG: 53EXOc protein [Patescibacteria group bacterium]|nr:53EXOc protein [Patescibacteria group bacterium]